MESKINATHRLRREGRWNEASLKRDEFRHQFQSAGCTRQEANQLAWSAMSGAFPPLTDDQTDWLPACRFMAMAAFPPDLGDLADEADEPRLEFLWWLWAHCLARLTRLAKQDWQGADYVTGEMLGTELDIAEEWIDAALVEPVFFVTSYVTSKFKMVAQRLLDAGEEASLYGQELEAAIALNERIRGSGVHATLGVMTDAPERRQVHTTANRRRPRTRE